MPTNRRPAAQPGEGGKPGHHQRRGKSAVRVQGTPLRPVDGLRSGRARLSTGQRRFAERRSTARLYYAISDKRPKRGRQYRELVWSRKTARRSCCAPREGARRRREYAARGCQGKPAVCHRSKKQAKRHRDRRSHPPALPQTGNAAPEREVRCSARTTTISSSLRPCRLRCASIALVVMSSSFFGRYGPFIAGCGAIAIAGPLRSGSVRLSSKSALWR